MFKICLTFSLFAVLMCPAVFADHLTLKNGDRLSGTVVKSDNKNLTFKSDLAGVVTIPWDAIDTIATEQPLYLKLKDGKTVVGKLAANAGRVEVQTKTAGKLSLTKSEVQAVRSAAEQAAFERMTHSRITNLWTGTVDAGLNLARGNSDTTSYTLAMNATRTTLRDKITLYSNLLYAYNDTEGAALKSADTVRGGGRYEVNVTDKYFAFGSGDFESDETQKLDLRAVTGGGLGWHALKNEHTLFDLFGGGSFNHEVFSTGIDRNSAELQASGELNRKLSPRMTIKQKLAVFPNLTDTGEYRMTYDASAITNVNKWLAWQVTLSDRYLSNPLSQVKNNDVLLTTGFRVTFSN